MSKNIIITKLGEIQSEVSEFHPVLKNLFNKMPSVIGAEYTHGTQEFGADFVLTRRDLELNVDTYIGIVAKYGKIRQSDTDVTRQINECQTIPRVLRGNKKIKINEVWVMCCGTISNNAKTVFSENSTISTIFFETNDIADLVFRHMPEYAGSVDIGIATYLARTEEYIQGQRDNAVFSVSSLNGYELEQELIRRESHNYKQSGTPKKRKTSNIFGLISKKKVTLIDGEMGSGKSTLMQKAALHYCNSDIYASDKRLPILVNYSDLIDKYQTIGNVIDETLSKEGIDHDSDRRYLILLDGWDEVKQSLDEKIKNIELLSNEANVRDDVKLIVAGREISECRLAGAANGICETYRLAPISIDSLVKLIENVFKNLNISDRIINDLRTSSIFKMLPKTPIAAMLLTRVIEENNHDMPSNLTELYSKYTELALGRWDIDKGLVSQKEYEVRERVCCMIAEYMMSNNLTKIALNEAENFFHTYLNNRNLGLDPVVLFNEFVSRNELVVTNSENGTFSFRHRTFVEFFYAKHMFQTEMQPDEEAFDFYWSTSFFFWVGLLRDCPEEISKLCAIQSNEFSYRLLKLINCGSMMLAGYQSPYKYIEDNVQSIFMESAEFYDDIRTGKIDCPFSSFSEMKLTAIFRYVLADAYGYRFFKEALGSSMVKIEDLDIDDNLKASSLFFMNLAYLDSGGDNIFDSMIENLGDKIPLSIQLAIQHEVLQKNVESNKSITKIHRRIRKLASDRSIKSQIENMYDKPINQLRIK